MSIDWNKVKALLLEDEPVVALSTEMDLQELGIAQVKVCYRLGSAQTCAQQYHYDVAILDINVQGPTTSIEFGRQLARDGTSVIFASGNNFKDTGLQEGEFVFISKPYSFQSIKIALENALKHKA